MNSDISLHSKQGLILDISGLLDAPFISTFLVDGLHDGICAGNRNTQTVTMFVRMALMNTICSNLSRCRFREVFAITLRLSEGSSG